MISLFQGIDELLNERQLMICIILRLPGLMLNCSSD
jgi:hypothetical protein